MEVKEQIKTLLENDSFGSNLPSVKEMALPEMMEGKQITNYNKFDVKNYNININIVFAPGNNANRSLFSSILAYGIVAIGVRLMFQILNSSNVMNLYQHTPIAPLLHWLN